MLVINSVGRKYGTTIRAPFSSESRDVEAINCSGTDWLQDRDWFFTVRYGVTDVLVGAGVLRHEVLNELDVRVARSLHARALPALLLWAQHGNGVRFLLYSIRETYWQTDWRYRKWCSKDVAIVFSVARPYNAIWLCTGWAKKLAPFVLYALTLSNTNRFSKLFHCQNQEKIRNNTSTKDLTTPQVCRYTALWNVKCLAKSNNWKQDDFCM